MTVAEIKTVEQIYYLRDKENKPIGTLAFSVDEHGHTVITGSACSPLDNFSYKAGRKIALKRLHSRNPKTRNICLTDIKELKDYTAYQVFNGLRLEWTLRQLNVDVPRVDASLKNIREFLERTVYGD